MAAKEKKNKVTALTLHYKHDCNRLLRLYLCMGFFMRELGWKSMRSHRLNFFFSSFDVAFYSIMERH